MGAKRANQAPASGFSLLELLLVIALMGLLAAFATPALFKSLTHLHLRTAAQKTVAIMRYAHNQAVTKSKPFWMVFDKEENLIALLDQPFAAKKSQDPEKESPGQLPNPMSVYSYPEDVIIEKLMVEGEEISGSQGVFIFYPNGSCNGGEIFLQANNSPRFYEITLHPITGIAKIAINESRIPGTKIVTH